MANCRRLGSGCGRSKTPRRRPGRRSGACGYRHFDCASDYGNEAEVGVGLQNGSAMAASASATNCGSRRNCGTRITRQSMCGRRASDRCAILQLDYLDLYLIHFPIALEYVPPEKRYPAGWFHDPDAARAEDEAGARADCRNVAGDGRTGRGGVGAEHRRVQFRRLAAARFAVVRQRFRRPCCRWKCIRI